MERTYLFIVIVGTLRRQRKGKGQFKVCSVSSLVIGYPLSVYVHTHTQWMCYSTNILCVMVVHIYCV